VKVCAYTIALNEKKFVERWVNSVRDCDYLVVADTGSTDGTVEALKSMGGVEVYSIKIKPWRFDMARNIALSLIPSDADACISLDMDEMMAPNWRAALEKAWLPGTTKLSYTYVHDFDANDNPLTVFMADKLHDRFSYKWIRPIHENISPVVTDEKVVSAPDVIMWHKQDVSKGRGQYLPLLKLSHEENPRDSQTLFWLARELMWKGERDEAVSCLKKYLAMPESGWNDERSEAMKYLGELLPNEKLKWLRLSAAEAPNRRETWLNLAEYYYSTGDWINLYTAAQEGTKITHRSHNYLEYHHAWGGKIWDLAGLGAWNIGLKEQSLQMFEKAAELEPNDGRIAGNLQYVKNAIEGNSN